MLSLNIKSRRQSVAGLTISDEGIAVARIRPASPSPILQSCQFYPCHSSNKPQILSQAIKEHNLNDIHTNLVLLPDEYQLIQVDAPEVPNHELDAALRWQIKDLIDFHIDDAVVDHLLLPDLHTSGKKQLLVVISRKSSIQQYVDLLSHLHCRLTTIDIAVQAARNLISQLTEQEDSVGLLNLWDDFSKISVISNYDIYINRLSSIGLNTLNFAHTGDENSQAVIDSLAVELQRTFDYFERHAHQSAISTLFIIANSPQQLDLESLLHQRLGIDCITPDIFNVVAPAQDIIGKQIDNRCIMAIGGALRGVQS